MPKLRRPTRNHQDLRRLGRALWGLCTLASILVGVACARATPPAEALWATAPPPTAAVATPAPPATPARGLPSPSPTAWVPSLAPTPTPRGGGDPIAYLLAHPMPPRDEARLAREFLGREAPPAGALCRNRGAPLGTRDAFWVGHVEDTFPTWEPITATLILTTAHAHFWLEEGLEADAEALARSAQAFEERIYPTVTALLGLAGRDPFAGCPLAILNARVRGALGYYLSLNALPRNINPFSNERPTIVINCPTLAPGTAAYEATLAHELQHALLSLLDANEQAWVTEGLSELAEERSGYAESQSARAYLVHPNIAPLNWSVEPADLEAHYGAAYLLMRYLAQRYGEGALADLAREPADGLAGFEAILERFQPPTSFDAFFGDWLIANALNIPLLEGGRYGYPGLGLAPMACSRVEEYPFTLEGALEPYGAACWELPLPEGGLTISFQGRPEARLVPTDAASGRWMWWSNQGDQGHSTLERTLDLRAAREATLSYKVWFDIEEGWDYAYLRASADDGKTWTLLRTPAMRAPGAAGYALGPGYTGASGGWVAEEVPLDRFAGQVIRLRFDYITDDAVHGAGLCLDDVRVEAIGWADDVEAGEEGWRAEGFLRIENRLPQRYLAQMARRGEGGGLQVQRLEIGDEARAEWLLAGSALRQESVYLILSAATPLAAEPAMYHLAITKS